MEITLKEVFNIFKKGLVFILIFSVVIASCAFFYAKFFISKTYTASVKLYVETTSETTTSGVSNNINDYNYAVKLVNTYIEMLETNKFYSQVAENLNNKYSATELSDMISFSALNETEVFAATVSASSPTGSKEIADSIAEVAPTIIGELNQKATLKIVDYATLPSSPSAPNVTNITLLAFFIGFILSTAIVFIRKIFDVKITYTDELTTICGVPVLSAIPDFDSVLNSSKK